MSDELKRVVAALNAAHAPYALIGGYALAAYGVVRGTVDLDLGTASPEGVLSRAAWSAFNPEEVEIRIGTPDDPLEGVVRIKPRSGRPIDVVVFGPNGWQRGAIDAAEPLQLEGVSLSVVTLVDLIRLKLYAAGPQDGWDVQALLSAAPDSDGLVSQVEFELSPLPERSKALWRRVRQNLSDAN